jgi:hypothetical protein
MDSELNRKHASHQHRDPQSLTRAPLDFRPPDRVASSDG